MLELTRKKNKKLARVVASILTVVIFVSSNGSFLVWGMSEGRLSFLGEPKVAKAAMVETAEAITVDEITGQNKNKENKIKKTFEQLKTKIVASKVFGGDFNGDLEENNLNQDEIDILGNKGMNSALKNSIVDEGESKKIGFFKKIWANFIGVFSGNLKTSILGDVEMDKQLADDTAKWLKNNQLKKEKKTKDWWDFFGTEGEKTVEEMAEEFKQMQLTTVEKKKAKDNAKRYFESVAGNLLKSKDKGHEIYKILVGEKAVSKDEYLKNPNSYILTSPILKNTEKLFIKDMLARKRSDELLRYSENKLLVVKDRLRQGVSSSRYLEILTRQFKGDKNAAFKEQQRRLKKLEDVELASQRELNIEESLVINNRVVFAYVPLLGGMSNKIFVSADNFIKEVENGRKEVRYAIKSGSVIEDGLEHELLHAISVDTKKDELGKITVGLRDSNVANLFKLATKSANEFNGDSSEYVISKNAKDAESKLNNATYNYSRYTETKKLGNIYNAGPYVYQALVEEEYVRAIGFLKSDLEKYFDKNPNEDVTQEQVDALIECAKDSDCRYKLHQHTLESVKILKKEKIPEILNTIADNKEYNLGNFNESYADNSQRYFNPITGEEVNNPAEIVNQQKLAKIEAEQDKSLVSKFLGLFSPRDSVADPMDNNKIQEGEDIQTGNTRYYQNGTGLMTADEYAQYKKKERVNDKSNSTQQAAKLNSIEKEKGWLASSWDTVTSWFGRDDKVELTDKEVKTFDGGVGESLVGIDDEKLDGRMKDGAISDKPTKVFIVDSGYSHKKCSEYLNRECGKIAGFYDLSSGKIKNILPEKDGTYETDIVGHGSEMASAYMLTIGDLINTGDVEIYIVKTADENGETDISDILPKALELVIDNDADVVSFSSSDTQNKESDYDDKNKNKKLLQQLYNKGVLISTIAGNYAPYYKGDEHINTLSGPWALTSGALSSLDNNEKIAFYTSGIKTGKIDSFSTELYVNTHTNSLGESSTSYGGTSTAGAIAGAEMALWKEKYAKDYDLDGDINLDDYKLYTNSPESELSLTVSRQKMTYQALVDSGYSYNEQVNKFISPNNKEYVPLVFDIVDSPKDIVSKMAASRETAPGRTASIQERNMQVGLVPFLEMYHGSSTENDHNSDEDNELYNIGYSLQSDEGYRWSEKYQSWIKKNTDGSFWAVRLDDLKKYRTGQYLDDINNKLVLVANNGKDLENKIQDKNIGYIGNITLLKNKEASKEYKQDVYEIIGANGKVHGFLKGNETGKHIIYNTDGKKIGEISDAGDGNYNLEDVAGNISQVKGDSLEEALFMGGFDESILPFGHRNLAEDARNLKAIEEKKGWLASSWDTVTSWFGKDDKVELTDKEVKTFDDGVGESLVGIDDEIGDVEQGVVVSNNSAGIDFYSGDVVTRGDFKNSTQDVRDMEKLTGETIKIEDDLEVLMNDEELFGFVEDSVIQSLPICPVFSQTTTAVMNALEESSDSCRSVVSTITTPISGAMDWLRGEVEDIPIIKTAVNGLTGTVDLLTEAIDGTAGIADKVLDGTMTVSETIGLVDTTVAIVGGAVSGSVGGAAIVSIVPSELKESTVKWLNGDMTNDEFLSQAPQDWKNRYNVQNEEDLINLAVGTTYTFAIDSLVGSMGINSQVIEGAVKDILTRSGSKLIVAGNDEEKIEKALIEMKEDIGNRVEFGARDMTTRVVLDTLGLNSSNEIVRLVATRIEAKQEVERVVDDVFSGDKDVQTAIEDAVDNMGENAAKEIEDLMVEIENAPLEVQKAIEKRLKIASEKGTEAVSKELKEIVSIDGENAIIKYVNNATSQEIDKSLEMAKGWLWDDKTIEIDIDGKAESISVEAAKMLKEKLDGEMSNIGVEIEKTEMGDILLVSSTDNEKEFIRIAPNGQVISQADRIESELEKVMSNDDLFGFESDGINNENDGNGKLVDVVEKVEDAKSKIGDTVSDVCTELSCVISESGDILGEGADKLGFTEGDETQRLLKEKKMEDIELLGKDLEDRTSLWEQADYAYERGRITKSDYDAFKSNANEFYLDPEEEYSYNAETKTYDKCGFFGKIFSSDCQSGDVYARNSGVNLIKKDSRDEIVKIKSPAKSNVDGESVNIATNTEEVTTYTSELTGTETETEASTDLNLFDSVSTWFSGLFSSDNESASVETNSEEPIHITTDKEKVIVDTNSGQNSVSLGEIKDGIFENEGTNSPGDEAVGEFKKDLAYDNNLEDGISSWTTSLGVTVNVDIKKLEDELDREVTDEDLKSAAIKKAGEWGYNGSLNNLADNLPAIRDEASKRVDNSVKEVQDWAQENNIDLNKDQFKVLVDMRYNMGPRLDEFKGMKEALIDGDNERAALEILFSNPDECSNINNPECLTPYCRQTKDRCRNNATIMAESEVATNVEHISVDRQKILHTSQDKALVTVDVVDVNDDSRDYSKYDKGAYYSSDIERKGVDINDIQKELYYSELDDGSYDECSKLESILSWFNSCTSGEDIKSVSTLSGNSKKVVVESISPLPEVRELSFFERIGNWFGGIFFGDIDEVNTGISKGDIVDEVNHNTEISNGKDVSIYSVTDSIVVEDKLPELTIGTSSVGSGELLGNINVSKKYRYIGTGWVECSIASGQDDARCLDGSEIINEYKKQTDILVDNQINAPPEDGGGDYGLHTFLDELMPVSTRINLRAKQYTLDNIGQGIDSDKILEIAGDELIRYGVDKVGTVAFGDNEGQVSWFGRDIIDSAGDIASSLAFDNKNGAWIAGIDFALKSSLDAAKESGELVDRYDDGKLIVNGAISEETFSYLRNGGKEALLAGVSDYLNNDDIIQALEITGGKLAIDYLDKVATPYLTDFGDSIAQGFTDDSVLSESLGAGLSGAVIAGGGNAILQTIRTGEVDWENVIESAVTPAAQAGFEAYNGITELTQEYQAAVEALRAAEAAGDTVAVASATSDVANASQNLSTASDSVGNAMGYVKVALAAYEFFSSDEPITVERTAQTVVTTGVSFVPVVGWALAMGLDYVWTESAKPTARELEDWKYNTQEAVAPSLTVEGISNNDMANIATVAAHGNTSQAKSMMRSALSKSSIGKIANVTGLGGVFESAVAIMNNRITRMNNDFEPMELENDTEDGIDTGDIVLDNATNKFIHLKNKLKDCYYRGDKKCVQKTSIELTSARRGVYNVTTDKFALEIKVIENEIFDLEVELKNAKTELDRVRIQNRINSVKQRKENVFRAGNQMKDIIYSGNPRGNDSTFKADLARQRKAAECKSKGWSWNGTVCINPGAVRGGNGSILQSHKYDNNADIARKKSECTRRGTNWYWDGQACRNRQSAGGRFNDNREYGGSSAGGR